MKYLLFLFFLTPLSAKDYVARVTYYWTGHQTSTGAKLERGVAAVDPKIIHYGCFITIPRMGREFRAFDTGPDVVKKRASRGKHIVVDIYCKSKVEAQGYIKKYPPYMKIEVKEKK